MFCIIYKIAHPNISMAEVDTLNKPPKAEEAAATTPQPDSNIKYVNYQSEAQMPDIMQLVKRDLSEPYSVYTYRYFINTWEKLCFMAYDGEKCIGAIVCKLDPRDKTEQPQSADHNDNDEQKQQQEEPELTYKGYIAMLVVEREYRKKKIGSRLVKMAVTAMKESKADEVILETEVPNKPALKLYENLGFLRDKRLFRYYLNGLDALRLRLWIN